MSRHIALAYAVADAAGIHASGLLLALEMAIGERVQPDELSGGCDILRAMY